MEGKCGSLSSSIFINYYKLSKINKQRKKIFGEIRQEKRRDEFHTSTRRHRVF